MKTHPIPAAVAALAASTLISQAIPVGGEAILKEYDSNRNRQIDQAELDTLEPSVKKTLMKRYDKDLDGTITKQELGVSDRPEKPKKKGGGGKKKKKKKR
ncbi:hypothetical protein HAHE_11980 [Haloferula helveola]|uniref:EF-hand domain-containing protein n=1 Tax=Haloferula helveola TaxID=490095 RepID=A0ABM7RD50_9BACT|nr:hypothetical protein HAHE_11980 [Haloferula helveola]